MGDDGDRDVGRKGDRGKVAQGGLGQVPMHCLDHGVGIHPTHDQGVPIGARAGDMGTADSTGGAGAVLDQHLLAEAWTISPAGVTNQTSWPSMRGKALQAASWLSIRA